MIDIIALYCVCASTFTISKETLSYTSPFFYIGSRLIIAGLLSLGIFWYKQKCTCIKNVQVFPVHKKDVPLILQLALFSMFFAYIGDLWSLQFLTSIESALIYNLSPFVAALFSYLLLNERLSRLQVCGLCIGVSSLIPLVIQGNSFSIDHAKLLPILALLGAVFSASYGWIITRELVKNRSYQPLIINGIASILGGSGAMLLSLTTEAWQPMPPVTNWYMFSILLLGIIISANLIFTNFYSYLLKKYTATLLAFSGFMCPIFVALFGVLFLGEQITWQFIFSVTTVTLGLSLFYREETKATIQSA